MVELRMSQREIVFRVLYVGDDGATKFATIRSLHESLCLGGESINILHAGGDRIVSFRHRPRLVEPLFGLDVAVETMTVPGRPRCVANAQLLLEVADAVIYLDDRSHREDEAVVSGRFGAFVDRLSAARSATDVPFFVQCYADGPESRHELFRTAGAWTPDVEVLEADARPRVVFERVQSAVIGAAREWERDLRRRGMTEHVKIRDRIYEKVSLLPAPAADGREFAGEVRLVQSLTGPDGRRARRLFLGAALLVLVVAAAAFAISLFV